MFRALATCIKPATFVSMCTPAEFKTDLFLQGPLHTFSSKNEAERAVALHTIRELEVLCGA